MKTAATWTGTNERTAKNWLAGRSGPSGQHLAALVGRSDEVLCTFLLLADRGELLAARRLVNVRDKLQELLREIDGLLEVASDR